MQQKERRSSYPGDSMDGPGEHYAKSNKPSGEKEIPHDLTYKWNLINKTNKQTKYNQRHINKEQSDSDQRGGGRGIRNPSRNMYEGHMNKTKRWEVQIGGEGGMVG